MSRKIEYVLTLIDGDRLLCIERLLAKIEIGLANRKEADHG